MAFKLFAVLAFVGGVAHADTPRLLRNGAPAAGNTMGKSDGGAADAPAVPTPVEIQAMKDLGTKLLALVSFSEPAVQPRQIHGRPACGNVASRAPRPRDCP